MSPIRIRLRELRTARGLTQVQLAELCGMPQSTISRIESGTTTGVDFETLDKVAAALGVHPSELIVYDRVPFEHEGRTYVMVDVTGEVDELPPDAVAVWKLDGTNITFVSRSGDTPADLVKRAREKLG